MILVPVGAAENIRNAVLFVIKWNIEIKYFPIIIFATCVNNPVSKKSLKRESPTQNVGQEPGKGESLDRDGIATEAGVHLSSEVWTKEEGKPERAVPVEIPRRVRVN